MKRMISEMSYSRGEILKHFSHEWKYGGFNDNARNNPNLWKTTVPHPRASGTCYTYSPPGENPPGKWTSYKIYLQIPVEIDATKPASESDVETEKKKRDFFSDVSIFLHSSDSFLYYREDDMPDMIRIENSLLNYKEETSIVFKLNYAKYLSSADRQCSNSAEYNFKDCVDSLYLEDRDWQDPWYWNININKTKSTNKTQVLDYYSQGHGAHNNIQDRQYKSKENIINCFQCS
ncbi:uncharacterized protein LOC111699768 [Eurytemora carolleeae]|uniref:uncharacterized protein LOC111699768 n=1 Tax=Eurytemora carolleeae TaxID=1294199 RepID=UPI000C764294|nr:uncharacterized protein LOC111699768 [Eurytemora carolleeae]|eukprot:XP_023326270.1 uncharacterized protein LOC111699768 [Eurytemora affinis]